MDHLESSPTLFIASTSERSGRTAVIAEELDSVWLYLSAPGKQSPEQDCWILNTPAAANPIDFYRTRGSPPPAPGGHVAPGGTRDVPAAERWSLSWSADGDSVAAMLEGTAVGFISPSRPRGVARYILEGAAAWAHTWDEDSYRRTFQPSSGGGSRT